MVGETDMQKLTALVGIAVFLLIAVLFSRKRRSISWRTVWAGLLLQGLIAILMLKTPVGKWLFFWINRGFDKLQAFSNVGSRFVFGKLCDANEIGAIIAFQVLPLIIFVSALMGLLIYLGIIPLVVRFFARIFLKTMRITGIEAFMAALQIFMGIEAVTAAGGYIRRMNESRLFTLMVTFMGTIAGSVMAAYVSFGAQAGHLLTASLLSAPAAVVIAKIMIPDDSLLEAEPIDAIHLDKPEKNFIEALANGAASGLQLALQIGAMLIAFVATVALVSACLGKLGISLQKVMGYAMAPFSILLGIPVRESVAVGNLLGVKVLFNEFLAYLQLQTHMVQATLAPRTIEIATYALCGFTNFGSMAIMIGGIGALVPEQKPVVARLALKALLAGFLANMMAAAVASILL